MEDVNTVGISSRWGIMATGGIARKFARAVLDQGIQVAAVASRDAQRAETFAVELGIPKAYGGYEALLADPDINSIYLALPNHLHAEWSIKAARAGKHILCEKPGAMDEAECRAVLRAVDQAGVFYMEGFMYRLHPMWGMVQALIAEGYIGGVRKMHSSFCFDMGEKPDNIRQISATGGGALLDIGCYCLSFSRMIAGCEPVVARASSRLQAGTGIDEVTNGTLEFPAGLVATFQCAIRMAEPNLAIIYGDRGRIEIPAPWHPPKDGAEIKLWVDGEEPAVYRAGDGLAAFAREAMHVEEYRLARQSPVLSWEDSLGQARAMENLRRSAGLL